MLIVLMIMSQSLHTYRQASRRLRSHASIHATDLLDFFSSIDTR
jgi:hypothetical protein